MKERLKKSSPKISGRANLENMNQIKNMVFGKSKSMGIDDEKKEMAKQNAYNKKNKKNKSTATKKGKVDKRKTGRKLAGGRHGAKSTSASKGLLVVAALDLGARGAKAAASFYDNKETQKDIGILRTGALTDLRNALQDGLIPQEHLNYNDLSVILNSIFHNPFI